MATSLLTNLKKLWIYLLVAITPLAILPVSYGNTVWDLRVVRDTALYSSAIIFCSLIIKNIWLRLFLIWCVLNWWLHFFQPLKSYIVLTQIVFAVIIYMAVKYFIRSKIVSIDTLLRIIVVSAIFQFGWLMLQKMNIDTVFNAVNTSGAVLSDFGAQLVGWSGNSCVLGVALVSTIFLLLNYFRFKYFPILFFVIASSVFILKNATSAICFIVGLSFYVCLRYRLKRYSIISIFALLIMLGLYFVYIKQPNFDRYYIWSQVFKNGIKLHPFIGMNLASFENLQIVDKAKVVWKEMHNDYLQLILEAGLIGFGLFIGFIISKVVEFFNAVRDNRQICMFCCLIAFLVSAISIFPLHLSQLSFNAIIILACLEESYKNDTVSFNTVNA